MFASWADTALPGIWEESASPLNTAEHGWVREETMAAETATISLKRDPYAPLEARHAVMTIDAPSPDLRDVVTLLVSEVVTSAVRAADEGGGDRLVLHAEMPRSRVRVELSDPRGVAGVEAGEDELGYRLVDELSDRWGVQRHGDGTLVWFEIDR
jgi:hypothetical protein